MLRHLRVHDTILLLHMFENVLNKSTKLLPQKGVCQPSWAPSSLSGTCDLVFSLALSSLSPIYCSLVIILVPVSGGGVILSRTLGNQTLEPAGRAGNRLLRLFQGGPYPQTSSSLSSVLSQSLPLKPQTPGSKQVLPKHGNVWSSYRSHVSRHQLL